MIKNRTYFVTLFLAMFVTVLQSNAQFITVKDTALARFLCDSIPSVMSTDCKQLDTVKAKKFAGKIIGYKRGITDISEITYFKLSTDIVFEENAINNLPDFSGFSNLITLNLNGNKLSGDIDFSKYSKLQFIILNRNYGITGITGISQIKPLQSLQIINCNLTSAPNFGSLSNLEKVYLYKNHLTFKDIIPLTKISDFSDIFVLFPQYTIPSNDTIITKFEGENLTLQFVNDSSVSGLTYTWYHNNKMVKTDSLFSLTKANLNIADSGDYIVSIKSNKAVFSGDSLTSRHFKIQIKPLPPTGQTQITYCKHESATALLANGSNLLWYSSANGGIGNKTAPTPSTNVAGHFTYYVSQTYGTFESTRLQITVTVNETAIPKATSSVIYTQGDIPSTLSATGSGLLWYTDSTISISNTTAFTPSTQTIGITKYYVSQTLNACESNRAEIVVQVNSKPTPIIEPCPTNFAYELHQENYCDSIILTITVNDIDTSKYSFYLENSFSHKKTSFIQSKKINIHPGTYSIFASNGSDCLVNIDTNRRFDFKDDCTKYFTPNGDGINDTWLIQDTGNVTIINAQGQLVKELDCPAEWDGTSKNNSPLPDGKYIIIFPNSSKSAISLFR